MANRTENQILQVIQGEGQNPADAVSLETRRNSLEIVEGAKGKKTLKEYMDALAALKDSPDKVEKLRQLKLVLISLGEHMKIDPNKVGLVQLPGDQVGEAYENSYVIDPVLLEKEDLSLLEETLSHEQTHLLGVDNEGLTQLNAMRTTGGKTNYYENLVHNVLQVTTLLGPDQNSGILRAVELYSNKKYDKLFEEFEISYSEKYSDRVAKNPDAAFNLFQLAFPELRVSNEGEMTDAEETEYAGTETEPESELDSQSESPSVA